MYIPTGYPLRLDITEELEQTLTEIKQVSKDLYNPKV